MQIEKSVVRILHLNFSGPKEKWISEAPFDQGVNLYPERAVSVQFDFMHHTLNWWITNCCTFHFNAFIDIWKLMLYKMHGILQYFIACLNHIKTACISLKSPGQFHEFPEYLKETFQYSIMKLFLSESFWSCYIITANVPRTLKRSQYQRLWILHEKEGCLINTHVYIASLK